MKRSNVCSVEGCNNRAKFVVKMKLGYSLINVPMCGKCLQVTDFESNGNKISIDRVESRSPGTGVWREGEKWRCRNCGNEVVVTNSGRGTLSCCDEDMYNFG